MDKSTVSNKSSFRTNIIETRGIIRQTETIGA